MSKGEVVEVFKREGKDFPRNVKLVEVTDDTL